MPRHAHYGRSRRALNPHKPPAAAAKLTCIRIQNAPEVRIMNPNAMFRAAVAAVLLAAVSAPRAAAGTPASPAADTPRYERALPTAEVLIDAGHGGIDGGAHFGSVLEKDINLQVAKRLYLMLRSQGIPAVLNRSGDYALSDENRWHPSRSRHQRDLSQRRGLTDEIAVQLLVSLHVNWSGNEKASGPLVLHQEEGRSALLAAFLQDALNREYGSRRLPKVGKPYYLLNLVKRPAVIVELGFLSSPADRAKLTDPRWQQRLAEAVAAGIRQYLWTAG
jgi:N-acetylmuramoyl-L-alanine amidase